MLFLSLTATGPLNQYTLPSVDLSDLFEQKRAQVAEKARLSNHENENISKEEEKVSAP